MNQEKLEVALRAIANSGQINSKFSDTFNDIIKTDTTEIEEIFWKNIYETPLNLILEYKSLIQPESLQIVINHITNGVTLFQTIVRNIFNSSKSRTTYQSHKQNSNDRTQMQAVSRSYMNIARLYLYLYKLKKTSETPTKILENYYISFITNPSMITPITEICEFLKNNDCEENRILMLAYSVKAFYLSENPESTKFLNEICTFISENSDASESQNILSGMAEIIKNLTNKNMNEYDSNIEFYPKFLDYIMNKIFEDIESQNISDDIYYLMCSISIFLLEYLRRTDSLRFESMLLHFSKSIEICMEKLMSMVSPKSSISIGDSSSIRESMTYEMSNDEESEGPSDCEIETTNITYKFNFSPERKPMEGLRSCVRNTANKPKSFDITLIEPLLKGFKLLLDWFAVYNEAVNVIKEVSLFDVESALKNMAMYLIYNDIEMDKKRFLPEDFTFFGHPSFFNVHNELDLNEITFQTHPENSKYRINYILKVINDGKIFNALPSDPSVYMINNNKTWSSKRARSTNGNRNFSRRHNKTNTDPFLVENGMSHRQRGFTPKNSKLERIHIICFYEAICLMDFITDLLYGKIFRVYIPYTVLGIIDRNKDTEHYARRISKYLMKNAKMKGLRVQNSSEFNELEATTPPRGCDEKTFKYIDGVLKTALYHLRTEPSSQPVVVLITDIEKNRIFGSSDLTSINVDQFSNLNCLLKPAMDRGLKLMTVEEFKEEYIV